MVSLKKNKSFCQEGDYFFLDGGALKFLRKDRSEGQMKYCFEKFDYEEKIEKLRQNTNLWTMVFEVDFTRSKLEKFYKSGKLQEMEPAKVAKLKLL